VLDDLEERGLVNDTIIALMGDHGWSLGENNMWAKSTNFEIVTRIPLIIKGAVNESETSPPQVPFSWEMVEAVDVYPTLASLAGVPARPGELDGVDLSPLMKEESLDQWGGSPFAFSEFPRCADEKSPWTDAKDCTFTEPEEFQYTGISLRKSEWRCTFWMHWDTANLRPDFSQDPAAVELYRYAKDTERMDFDEYETANVAEKYPQIVEDFFTEAQAQWDPQRDVVATTSATDSIKASKMTPNSHNLHLNHKLSAQQRIQSMLRAPTNSPPKHERNRSVWRHSTKTTPTRDRSSYC